MVQASFPSSNASGLFSPSSDMLSSISNKALTLRRTLDLLQWHVGNRGLRLLNRSIHDLDHANGPPILCVLLSWRRA